MDTILNVIVLKKDGTMVTVPFWLSGLFSWVDVVMITNTNAIATKICIGVVSRDRREMVANLLDSIAKLKRSSTFTFEVVLVENGTQLFLRSLVDEFRTRSLDIPIHYIHEPNIGIVYARNTALDFARSAGFDKLAFVDDDEVVEPEWLLQLHTAQTEQKLDLIGGPVRSFLRARPIGFFQRMLWKSYMCRSLRVEQVSNRRNAKGHCGHIMLATNNWMLDLNNLTDKTQRFDMRYNLSGGEDTAFFYEFKKAGGKTGWARNAIVKEEIPLERLTVKYQYERARDQSLVSFHRKYDNRPLRRWLTVPLGVIYKFLAASIMVLMPP